MPSVIIQRKNDHVIYNAAIHGYNTNVSFWKTLSGTPAISSSKLRLTSASVASLLSYLNFQARFVVNLPVEPAALQDKFWGFAPFPGANNGKVGFLISGTTFKAVAYDNDGNAVLDQTLTFDPAWDAADTVWEITVNTSGVFLGVNGTVLAKADVASFSTRGSTQKRISTFPGFIYISNGNADNMDVSSVLIIGTNSALPMGASASIGDIASETAGADAGSNTSNRLPTSSRMYGFNGTTWDRIRTAVTTIGSTFTGFLNALPWSVFYTTPGTRTNGQGGPLLSDALGNILATLKTLIEGEDQTFHVLKTQTRGTYTTPITASALVFTGPGQLLGFVVNSCAAGATLKIWDNTAGSGTVAFNTMTFTTAVAEGPRVVMLPAAVQMGTGCYFTIAVAAMDVTPIWNQ